MRKWVVGLLLLLTGSAAAMLAYAPYLPQLVLEGFPPLVWSGQGHFAPVDGESEPRDLLVTDGANMRALVPELEQPFKASGGKALLVYRAGHLELEHYVPGVSAETRFNSYSMAKSLVGALVYRALAENRVSSLDATLGELLPGDRGLQDVTLRALLNMRAGIAFDADNPKFGGVSGKGADTSPNPFGPLARLHFLGLGAIERELTVESASDHPFNYQSVNTALLGEVLEAVYRRPLAELLSEKIWTPAAAGSAFWRRPAAKSPVSAYCCIYATARDWVRVGLFLSENGTAGEPFLPTPLWREFMGLDVSAAELRVDHYGAHIRQNVLDRNGQALQGPFTYLLGQGGQVLYLLPQHDLVVYRAGDSLQLLHSTLYGAWNSLPSSSER